MKLINLILTSVIVTASATAWSGPRLKSFKVKGNIPSALRGGTSGVGGGGGGFCNAGNCVTLAEAGIQLKNNSEADWTIPGATLIELEKITSALPFGGADLLKATIGKLGISGPSAPLDEASEKEIIRDYLKVMNENNFSAPAGELKVFAFSHAKEKDVGSYALDYERYGSTYLFPAFFRLNPRQQALILIHEACIREGFALERAIEFDSLLLSYLKDPNGKSFDYLRFVGALRDLPWTKNYDYESQSFAETVTYLSRKSGKVLSLANFRDEDFPEKLQENGHMVGNASYLGQVAMAKSSAQIDPRFANIFGSFGESAVWMTNPMSPLSKHEYISVGKVPECRGRERLSRLEKFILIRYNDDEDKERYGIVAVDCSIKSKSGEFGGYRYSIQRLSLGNFGAN